MAKVLFMHKSGKMARKIDVEINLSQEFNRRILPEQYEEEINKNWDSRLATNSNLWNGTKFRLHNITEAEGTRLKFKLGITNYKDFLGTNYSKNAKGFQEIGIKQYNNSQAYLADPLGVGAIVFSNDNKIPFIRRSKNCGEAVGELDIPGGHPEPEEIFGKKDKDEVISTSLMSNSLNSAIAQEIFQSILREVQDEINIPIEKLDEPHLMGIAGNEYSANKPTAEFLIRCSLHSEEIKELYNKGTHTESFESTELLLIPLEDLMELEKSCYWKELTSSAKAALQLYIKLT